MEETELIENIKTEQPGAFKDLVEQYQEKVLNTCYRFTNNKEDAEDVAQDVFVAIYQALPKFRGNAKLSTWIYRIAVTKSLDLIRSRKRKKRFARVQSIFKKGEGEREEELQIPHPDNPHKDLEHLERAVILRKAVDSLVENQRVAITLNKYEGFNCQEIAEIMGTTQSAVEALIHRAKKKLHKKLYNYYNETT
ncbi:RNA polymerase sigma factor [candidate division KSB1 bacterium]|nr:RNA polymerase sigma factor [candidate division KSB1 bacterium]